MKITLSVTEGPHQGEVFEFREHDTFIVGRSPDAHFRLPQKDKTLSRFHFLVEVNPPCCRLLDMASTNGTFVNGREVPSADLNDGDVLVAGRTTIVVAMTEAGATGTVTPAVEPIDSLLTRAEVSPSVAAGDPSAPFSLRRYRIVRELGRGGMGVVHLAVTLADGSPVAIKTITPAVAGSDATLARFLREAGILRRLDHPSIVRFLEVGHADGRFYFAMEYVPGLDAADLMKELGSPLPIGRGVNLACQILDGLAYAHAMGFVHRDIKPNNLLVANLNGRDVAKLADFGLARTYQTSPLSGLSMTGEFGGTAGFLAPEQITNFRQARPATDLYAVGATLYHLLTGTRPYDFPSNVERQLLMILQDDPIPIRQRNPEVPEALAEVIHRSLARNPADRFPDAVAMCAALVPFRKGL